MYTEMSREQLIQWLRLNFAEMDSFRIGWNGKETNIVGGSPVEWSKR